LSQSSAVQGLTIQEAAATAGWSPRMLRYLERVGLLDAMRSPAGYRVYGAAEIQRLRTLRELLAEHHLELSDVALAKRLRDDPRLAEAIATWLDTRPLRPATVASSDWLQFEQEKSRRLLASAAAA
jgi:DNA-binding transcriptional MerR regulator